MGSSATTLKRAQDFFYRHSVALFSCFYESNSFLQFILVVFYILLICACQVKLSWRKKRKRKKLFEKRNWNFFISLLCDFSLPPDSWKLTIKSCSSKEVPKVAYEIKIMITRWLRTNLQCLEASFFLCPCRGLTVRF